MGPWFEPGPGSQTLKSRFECIQPAFSFEFDYRNRSSGIVLETIVKPELPRISDVRKLCTLLTGTGAAAGTPDFDRYDNYGPGAVSIVQVHWFVLLSPGLKWTPAPGRQ